MKRQCPQCEKEFTVDKYNQCLWCSIDCRQKWFAQVPEKYSKIYNEIISEIDDNYDVLRESMCQNCKGNL